MVRAESQDYCCVGGFLGTQYIHDKYFKVELLTDIYKLQIYIFLTY